MTDSIITRCPKCSTAFRVGTDILSMAKGKVRCGQCFHIFEAKPIEENKHPDPSKKSKTSSPEPTKKAQPKNVDTSNKEAAQTKQLFSAAEEDHPINPEWLHTLFDDADLTPIDKHNHEANLNKKSRQAIEKSQMELEDSYEQESQSINEPAPWELEFAELDPVNSDAAKHYKEEPSKEKSRNANTPSSAPAIQIFDEKIQSLSKVTEKPTPTNAASNNAELASYSEESPEPDYMKALHTLAQSTSSQPENTQDTTNKAREAAQERLAPLINNDEPKQKKNHTALWLLGIFFSMVLLSLQAAFHFFEEGSRSSTFRPFYKTFCSYMGCTLPNFVDISAINIQHVRIQSHPTQNNALVVNAIMTNTSNYSQTMPKISLEFFDLNGAPVAARLFSPNSFLHKDFLDITYMPPNTPIHIVLPIYDPGTQAVTHRLKVHASDTQSY